ncbi:hypothetical protein ANCCAN_28037, partial [Ancylostoma caninum]
MRAESVVQKCYLVIRRLRTQRLYSTRRYFPRFFLSFSVVKEKDEYMRNPCEK